MSTAAVGSCAHHLSNPALTTWADAARSLLPRAGEAAAGRQRGASAGGRGEQGVPAGGGASPLPAPAHPLHRPPVCPARPASKRAAAAAAPPLYAAHWGFGWLPPDAQSWEREELEAYAMFEAVVRAEASRSGGAGTSAAAKKLQASCRAAGSSGRALLAQAAGGCASGWPAGSRHRSRPP